MSTIQNKDIQGPPFGCPECADQGKRTTFNGRGPLGSHRFGIHGVTGTSTGSRAYKNGKISHKAVATRTFTKRGAYHKTPKVNPVFAMLNDPMSFISEIDTLLLSKREEIANLQTQIQELNNSVMLLEKFRSTAQTVSPQAEPFYKPFHESVVA